VTADLHVRRVYEPPSPEDGQRVLVDRIWPRGVSKEVASLSLWLRDVAPSTELRQWFAHDPAKWEDFQRRYFVELDANAEALAPIRKAVRKGPVTLLFSSHDVAHNNALALKRYLTSRRK